MRRIAYSLVLTPDGQAHRNAVVEFSDQGVPLAWHTLDGEEPFVVWQGGAYRFPPA